MATLAETIMELERLKHQRAVWMQTVEHLAMFVDQEVRQAEKGISAEGCIASTVPQTVIQEFIDRINEEEIEPLNENIEKIERMSVEETEEDDEPEDGESGGQTVKKADNGKKAGKTGRKIRSLGKPPGGKAQSNG